MIFGTISNCAGDPMPLDDLDRLLEQELGGSPDGRKISEKVSSLEAQVLNRIKRERPSEEEPALSDSHSKPPPPSEIIDGLTDPIYGYADAILPLAEALLIRLEEPSENFSDQDFSLLRTQMAEKLFALPEVEQIGKAAVFAAMAMCIDAANSKDAETRSAAKKRLEKLISALGKAKTEIDSLRARAVENFLKT